MRRVVIESPFAGETEADKERNVEYLRDCLFDSLQRGEAPFASHGLYPLALDDDDPESRKLGIEAGFRWGELAQAAVFYIDRGISRGMHEAIDYWTAKGLDIEFRRLEAWHA